MQQFVENGSINENKNSSDQDSMPPQAQFMLEQTTTAMQEIHQPFQREHQLNQLPHEWGEVQQQNAILQIRDSLDESKKNTTATTTQSLNRPSSPTNVSVGSSSNSSARLASKGSMCSSSSSMPSGRRGVSSPTMNAVFKPFSGVKGGAGVGMKGPTPEVAQQLRFPWKLHLLLERCEYEHQQKLAAAAAEGSSPNRVPDMPISWLPTGKAFKVHDKERFVKEVMPSFFGTQSFKTFQRNLNLWGFTRVSKGPQKDVCSHPLFLKGFPAVCQSMKRIVLKGTGRGNRAPLGGVDVSSVQAVVAAAAMQQQKQQQQVSQQQALNQGLNQIPHHIQAQQVLQQQQLQQTKTNNEVRSPQSNPLSHINLQNPQCQAQQNQYQQQVQHNQYQQQPQFVIENGTIQAAPMPSQQNLLVLPSAAPSSASTTVMWPNNQQQSQQMQQQQPQSLNMADANGTLQKSLQQLSTIIQQLNGCNAMGTASVNTNSVQTNTSNTTANFQQQQQQLASQALPSVIQQQQQPVVLQQQQQQQSMNNPNVLVTPSPISTQDLVTLLLQRNLQQQVSQGTPQQAQAAAPIQLQIPSSLFSNPQQQQQPQQQPVVMSNNAFATNTTSFAPQQQQLQAQQGNLAIGSNANTNNLFSQQQQQQQPLSNQLTSPSPPPTSTNQQQQLMQLLLQQNGWSTSSPPI